MKQKPKNIIKKIVIFGGAFNPPHVGHMTGIEAVLRNFPADEIWLLPSADRRDKKIDVSGKHRVRMLKICLSEFFNPTPLPPPLVKRRGQDKELVQSLPKIIISDLELRRPSLSTTFDTKKKLEKLYPKYKFYFLIGSPLLGDIRNKWVKGKELWKSAHFLALMKPGAKIPSRLPRNIKVLDQNIIWLDMSSTQIRILLRTGYSGIPYVTPSVAKYIKKNGLYK